MKVESFFHKETSTLTYLVYQEGHKAAFLIDPVLDYDAHASKVGDSSSRKVLEKIEEQGLNIEYILETHAHADHITGAAFFKKRFPKAKTAIHENIRMVQSFFKEVFNFDEDFETEGRSFDLLLKDGEKFKVGELEVEVLHTPGHTPACACFFVNGEVLFTGDAIFMPDFGTGRCDFPKGSAEDLYNSIQEKIYSLPDQTKIFVGHDYMPNGRELKFETTVQEEKEKNIQLKSNTTRENFVKFRSLRDSGLHAPKLLLASIQVNAQNGKFPKPEKNGLSYLKMPVNGLAELKL